MPGVLFLSVLNMSITASFVIVVVLLVRFFLKKVPKIFSYTLWAVVLFRLICSLSIESAINIHGMCSVSIFGFIRRFVSWLLQWAVCYYYLHTAISGHIRRGSGITTTIL